MTERELQQDIEALRQIIADDTAALRSNALRDSERTLLQNAMANRAVRIKRLQDQLAAVRTDPGI